MSLTTLHHPPIMDNSTANLAVDFIEPALSVSVRYDRGVGFFSSGWLRMVINGMTQFVFNNPKLSLVEVIETEY